MLSYGSVDHDNAYRDQIKSKLELHYAINENENFNFHLTNNRINFFLENVIKNHTFFKNKIPSTFFKNNNPAKNFTDLPFLEKKQLRKMTDDFISRHLKNERLYFKIKTSGSTGVPLTMWFDDSYYVSFFSDFSFFLRANKIRPKPLSVSMITASVFKNAVDYRILQPPINYSIYHRLNIHPSHWKSIPDILNFIFEENPLILRGMPSSLESLASYIDEYRFSKPIRPKILISISEMLLPTTRQKLKNTFDADVFDEYGLSETGVIGRECCKHNGFHINVVDYYVEIVNQDGTPIDNGIEGEIVVSNLYNSVIPLLRYKTGDYGVINSTPCTCGNNSPRIIRLTGRQLTRFIMPDGRSYNPFDEFGKLILDLPIKQFQLIQEKSKHITLYYTGNIDISKLKLVHELRNKIYKIHEESYSLKLLKIDQFKTTNTKFQSFLCLV
jgi:phenylacetate-CoA ligase